LFDDPIDFPPGSQGGTNVRACLSFAAAVSAGVLTNIASAVGETQSPVVLPSISVTDTSWKRLTKEERDRVEARYSVGVFDGGRFARILNVQIINESSPGSTAGAQLGSAIGQSQYIDHHNWHNYSATGQIAAGLLGALIGAMVDSRPQIAYRQVYTLRDVDGNVRTIERVSDSPVYTAVGVCIDTWNFSTLRDDQCDEYPREVAQVIGVRYQRAANAAVDTAQAAGYSPPNQPPLAGTVIAASSSQTALTAPPAVLAQAPSDRVVPKQTSAEHSEGVATRVAAVARDNTLPLRNPKYLFTAERFAKAQGCAAPSATMNIKTATAETFTVTCSNAAALTVRCEPDCRELQ
jgi:hypothetical protein